MFRMLTLATFIAFNVASASAADLHKATLYKNPQCGCCETYADYLRDNNFDVNVIATHDLPLIKDEHSVPKKFEGCHTMIVNDYVVEADSGTARTTTKGSDGGWRNGSGTPVSEMGFMYYVNLANLGQCDPSLAFCTVQPGWGLNEL